MKTRNLKWVLVAMFSAAQAWAGGLALNPEQLPAETAKSLREQIASARLKDAATFQTVAEIRLAANALDAKKRGGRLAPMGRGFKQLGPQALLPMLELLAFNKVSEAELTDGAKLSLEVGLLEAVGVLRDPRAEPVLKTLVALPGQDPLLTRAAAEAYGTFQTDEVAKNLVQLSRGDDVRAQAVRAGMGSCRRVTVAKELGAALKSASTDLEVVSLSRALSDVANAWAWKTPGVVVKGEQAQVRAEAARALMASFVSRTGELRQAASNALMVVDAPETPALISAASRGASPELKAALVTLKDRFDHNPSR